MVVSEMNKSSDLIENVGRRIIDNMMVNFPNIKKLKVKVVKIKPPINADVPQVEYIIKKKR